MALAHLQRGGAHVVDDNAQLGRAERRYTQPKRSPKYRFIRQYSLVVPQWAVSE